MTVYLAWTSADFREVDASGDLAGPWREVVVAAHGLAFVDSEESLSAVYHALKGSLPPDVAPSVAPVADLPKAKGLVPGTTTGSGPGSGEVAQRRLTGSLDGRAAGRSPRPDVGGHVPGLPGLLPRG